MCSWAISCNFHQFLDDFPIEKPAWMKPPGHEVILKTDPGSPPTHWKQTVPCWVVDEVGAGWVTLETFKNTWKIAMNKWVNYFYGHVQYFFGMFTNGFSTFEPRNGPNVGKNSLHGVYTKFTNVWVIYLNGICLPILAAHDSLIKPESNSNSPLSHHITSIIAVFIQCI